MLISHPTMGGQVSQAARKDQPSQQHSYWKDNNRNEIYHKRENFQARQPVGAYQVYTPLNTVRAEIYVVNKVAAWRKPLPLDTPGNSKKFVHSIMTTCITRNIANIQEIISMSW